MALTASEKQRLRAEIAARLGEMEPMFDPRCKLTFVMRSPHLPDGDVIVTSDSIPDVLRAIERLGTYEPV